MNIGKAIISDFESVTLKCHSVTDFQFQGSVFSVNILTPDTRNPSTFPKYELLTIYNHNLIA